MRLPIALTFLLLAAPATAAPIDYFTFAAHAPVEFIWQRSYANLQLSTVSETSFFGGFSEGEQAYFYLDQTGAKYFVEQTDGFQAADFPVATVTATPGHIIYKFAPGAIWTLNNLPILHGDGTSHRGNFSATLGEIVIDTQNDETGDVPSFRFHSGQWDAETAALLGLPGHDIYGRILWFIDFNRDDYGQQERFGRPYGYAAFAVPEPSLLGLLMVGGLAALRRIRR